MSKSHRSSGNGPAQSDNRVRNLAAIRKRQKKKGRVSRPAPSSGKLLDKKDAKKTQKNQGESHLLDRTTSSLSKQSQRPSSSLENDKDQDERALAPHVIDARNMTATQLKEKYPLTYDSWRNMKSRRHTKGATIAPEFEQFKSFLIHMGPRPDKNYTIDRTDNSNPEYGPGLCQWVDKRDQANNRSTTIYLTDDNGTCLPLTEWARRTGQKADTMRRHRQKGWTDLELIAGQKDLDEAVGNPLSHTIWPGDDDEKFRWEKIYQLAAGSNESRLDFLFRVLKMMMKKFCVDNDAYCFGPSEGPDGPICYDPDGSIFKRFGKIQDKLDYAKKIRDAILLQEENERHQAIAIDRPGHLSKALETRLYKMMNNE